MDVHEYALMDAAEDSMWWYRALHVRVLDALGGVDGAMLDVGCGTGGLLARRGGAGFGVDFSPMAARRAAAKSGCPVACGTVNALPFADTQFQAVVAADVLCHRAVDPDLALAEMWRVLKPGGRLVVNMPAYRWLLSAHDRQVHNARRCTAGELRRMLMGAGFERPSVRYWNGLLLPLMVVQRKLRPWRRDAVSDVGAFPPWLDAALHAITALERRCGLRLPAGGSVLGTAVRP